MARMKVWLQICITALVLLMGVSEDPEEKETEVKAVHNPFLDIALLYDESSTMGLAWKKSSQVWDDMQDWIEDYFKNSSITNANLTRFAVIGCGHKDMTNGGDVDVMLYFNGKGSVEGETTLDKILAAQKEVRKRTETKEYHDNVHGCANSAATKIFDEKMGDRKDAKNVALYITDCALYEIENKEAQFEAIRDLRKKVEKFLFICTSDNYTAPRNWYGGYPLLLKWLDNDKSLIFNFTTKSGLVEKLNDLLPKININVTYCKLNPSQRYSYTECKRNSDGSCSKMKYPNIVRHPNPPQYAPACSDNVTEQCDEKDCITSTLMASDDGTVKIKGTDSSGKEGKGLSVSDSPESNDTSKKSNSTDSSSGGGKDLNVSNSPGSENSLIIVGAVIGGLLLLIIVIVILVVVMARRRKKSVKTKHGTPKSIDSMKRSEKEKGMKVDLTEKPGSLYPSKMSKSVPAKSEKSKVVKNDKRVKGKGAKSPKSQTHAKDSSKATKKSVKK